MDKWNFPVSGYGEIKGIADSGIEMFRGTPLKSLAREICQNSLDAAVNDEPVKVEFSVFELSTGDIPGSDQLKDIFNRCLDFWKEQKSKRTLDFFNTAIDIMNSDKIKMLRISDFNTKGLIGSKEEYYTDWTGLTKSSGVSDKGGTAGGSYGIGKFAPFSCSALSTVFYSTYDIESVQASQGVSRLVTFKDANNEPTQGIGYFGESRNRPLPKTMNLDSKFSRVENGYGTDIYIAGYKYGNEDWQSEIILSIMEDFFVAIWNKKLIVQIDDIKLNQENLKIKFEEFKDRIPKHIYECFNLFINPDIKYVEENFKQMGNIKLKLQIGENLHKKVVMVRNTGMTILSKNYTAVPLSFSGIMLIEGKKINSYLRRLENPQHTNWEYNRSEEPTKAKENLRDLYNYVKLLLKKITKEDTSEEEDIQGLGEFLPDIPDDKEGKNEIDNIENNKIISIESKVKERKNKYKNAINSENSEKGKKGTNRPGGSGRGYIHDKNVRPPHKPSPRDPVLIHKEEDEDGDSFIEIKENKTKIDVKDIHIIAQDKTKGQYAISIMPNKDSENCYAEIFLSAESGRYSAPLLNAKVIGNPKANIGKNGVIKNLNTKKNQPLKMLIHLDYTEYCSMEVSLYEYKK